MTEESQDWRMIALQTGGGPRIYRIRGAEPAGVSRAAYASCVIVEWRYADEGLPEKPLSTEQLAFEKLLDPLDDNPNSLLMHVYTGCGVKEWCYYARDYPVFMQELNVALAGKPRYPIDILHDHDPVWKYWEGIKNYTNSGPQDEA